MGRLKLFQISLANTTLMFFPGQSMEGVVTIELAEPMQIRGVVLTFDGIAHVSWSEGSGKSRRSYNATEPYLGEQILLHGIHKAQGSTDTELSAGRHTFPFTYVLPMGIPSSQQHDTGRICYDVNCNIDIPWKFDKTTSQPFVVGSMPVDLNGLAPTFAGPAEVHDQKTLCCLCCKSGPIRVTLSTDRQAFVPGEIIKVFADITNGSNRAMKYSAIMLNKNIDFHAGKTRTRGETLGMVERSVIPKKGKENWSGTELVIPFGCPPSGLVGCNIMDIRYELSLSIVPEGLASVMFVTIPIVIGNIPYMGMPLPATIAAPVPTATHQQQGAGQADASGAFTYANPAYGS